MEIRVGPDGRVALHVGTLSTGQGHETMFAQMVSDWLCLPMDRIRVFQGDTDKALFGRGTFAQRSMGTASSSLTPRIKTAFTLTGASPAARAAASPARTSSRRSR